MGETKRAVTTVAVIDDDAHHLQFMQQALASEEREVISTTDPEEGWELVQRHRPQIVLLDLRMPGLSGMELLERIVAFDPGIEVILLTGNYSTESAVEAIRKGACDYLEKPVPLEKLRGRIAALVAAAQKRSRSLQIEQELLETFRLEGMVGRSPLMLDVFAQIGRVAPHFRTVLVTGETGTGKELVARALHRLSPAASGPFVVCNSAAVAETLFESELFGHIKGAFTGALQDKLGYLEFAHRGTLLLDEIGDMPLTGQTKLLRVVQSGEVQRVGSPTSRKVDVRVVAATNRSLADLVAAGKFREDLYYRLSMIEIKLPALAERKEDLLLLQRHFLERFSQQFNKPLRGIARRAQAVLARYSWPGNVRELENVIGHACMMAEGEVIDVLDLPAYLRAWSPRADEEREGLLPLSEVERRHLRRVLERVGGNKARAAEILGISRATLYRMLGEEPAVKR